eukprot:TRINITY_DN4986_c0_g1_i2.p1 TRINITY_DN4986_c0_g1~~TRINITY_DN4986_c0_g1_i2.p1  ORF type:complete len:332 (+),score=63.31 TRINITY_DN4986_c0_g1_i2:103-1098(+)
MQQHRKLTSYPECREETMFHPFSENEHYFPGFDLFPPGPFPSYFHNQHHQVESPISDTASPSTDESLPPEETNICPPIPDHAESVSVFHRPRGCKGLWQPIVEGERIRLTKGSGKKIKLEYVSKYHINPSTVDVSLVNFSGRIQKDGIKLEMLKVNRIESGYLLEVEIKLFTACKQFLVYATATDIRTGKEVFLSAKTVSFVTSTSGGGKKTTIKEPPNKKRKLDEEESETISLAAPSVQQTTVIDGSLTVSGIVSAKAFIQNSDIRLKTNIEDIVDALDIITKLKGKRYHWKSEEISHESGGNKVLGLIAQEVQSILPESLKRFKFVFID